MTGEHTPEQPRLTSSQEASLRDLCEAYEVGFDPEHYQHTPELSEGYVTGWLGGPSHAPQAVRPWGVTPARTTICVTVGPDTEPGVGHAE